MNRIKTATAAAAVAVVAGGTVALTGAAAFADVERNGRCGGGTYEFSVDREGRGFEVSFDLDDVRPGTKWRVAMSQDGKAYVDRVITADREGDVEVERNRPNTAGSDVFRVRATKVGGGSCFASITR